MASIFEPSLDLDEWAELLGLKGLSEDLLEGRLAPIEARAQIEARRSNYPGIGLDYVQALNALGELVDLVENAVDEQNDALADLEAALDEVDISFSWDRTRLMTSSEREDVEELQQELEEAAEDAEEAAEEAEEAADEIESEMEDLESDMDEIESNISDMEDAIDELESEEE